MKYYLSKNNELIELNIHSSTKGKTVLIEAPKNIVVITSKSYLEDIYELSFRTGECLASCEDRYWDLIKERHPGKDFRFEPVSDLQIKKYLLDDWNACAEENEAPLLTVAQVREELQC
jgi:hypothetical protein